MYYFNMYIYIYILNAAHINILYNIGYITINNSPESVSFGITCAYFLL